MPAAPYPIEDVFRENYARLVASLSLVAGRSAAEDAVQTAFERAGSRWRRVSRYENPAAWIRRVALNLLLNERRRLDRLTAPAPDDPSSPGPAVIGMDVERALEQLAPAQRAYVVLFYLEDMSIDEIATACDRHPGTVKSGLHDARRALALYLGEDYGVG